MRRAVLQALRATPSDLGVELAAAGWMELLHIDETSAFTSLFEEHGYLGAGTNALDVVTAAVMSLDGRAPVIWPLQRDATAAEVGGSGLVVMTGAVQRGGLHARTILCPLNDRLVSLAVSSVDEHIAGETVSGSPWVSAQVWGCPSGDLGSWPETRRRARLALASELVGGTRRIIDGAAVHIGSRRRSGLEALGEQAAQSGLAEASAKIVADRALIAACWADGSVDAAEWAVTVAAAAQDVVAHHAALICGEINPAQLHPMRFLFEPGYGRIRRFRITPKALAPMS
jgi:hypothetical protein